MKRNQSSPRTLDTLHTEKGGGNLKKAKEYNNVIGPPFFNIPFFNIPLDQVSKYNL